MQAARRAGMERRRNVRADLRAAIAACAAAAVTSCATSPVATGDRAFASRDYLTANASYLRALAANPTPADREALRFRVGLLLLLPDTPVHDAAMGRAVLAELASASAGGGYREAARFVLGLQTALESAETSADVCAAEISRLDGEVKAQESAGKAREDALQHLRASLAETQAQIRRLQEELRALKNIDLGRKP